MLSLPAKKDHTPAIVGGAIGGGAALILIVVGGILSMIAHHFKKRVIFSGCFTLTMKVAVLSQPLTSPQLLNTPAEDAVKTLTNIRKKKRIYLFFTSLKQLSRLNPG